MLKLWNKLNNFVQQESCMFTARDTVELMFPAAAILRVYNLVSGKEYFPEVDFIHHSGSRIIQRTKQSSMPYIPSEMMRPGEDAACFPVPGAMAVEGALDGGKLFFNNESFFAENQIVVDYRAEKIDFSPELKSQNERLVRFRKMLAQQQEINITLLGDSISEGFNASGYIGHEPFTPPYIVQTARYLEDRFRTSINLSNHAVNGTGCEYAVQHAAEWQNKKTDLLIIAYGMNDFQSISSEKFLAVNQQLIEICRRNNPECEVVLINSMTGHEFWECTRPGHDLEFAEKVRQFVESSDSSIALADVQKVWRKILEKKDFYDISGNGVNHPNDYGHRVYASVLLQLLSGVDMF